MFLFFIILHIPFIINYIIFKDKTVKKYMKDEMIKYHYIDKYVNPTKKKSKTMIIKKDSSKLNMDNINNNNNNNIVIHKIKTSSKTRKKMKKRNRYKFSNDIDSVFSNLVNNNNTNKTTRKRKSHNNFILLNNRKSISNKLNKENTSRTNNRKRSSYNMSVLNNNKSISNKSKKNKKNSKIAKYKMSYFTLHKVNNFQTISYFKKKNYLDDKNIKINNIYYNTFPSLKAHKNIIKNHNKKTCTPNLYSMIKIDANNFKSKEFLFNYSLFTDDFEEAIINEKRNFCNIFCLVLIVKQKIINTFFFSSPLEIQSLRICLVIFIYSCNFALNTLFFFSHKISDKYHYQKNNLILFSIVNNIYICFISVILSILIVSFLRIMTNSRSKIEQYFAIEEKKMKKNKNYFVNKSKKKYIFTNLKKILKSLKIKIIIFIISEMLLFLFLFYFVTAFCEVYKKTQITWIIDCITSTILSFIVDILISLILAILYIFSVKQKIKFLYSIIWFLI